MPRINKYRVEVLREIGWEPSVNFEHRANGPVFKSRVAAERGLFKYGSSRLRFEEKHRIVPVRKEKKTK